MGAPNQQLSPQTESKSVTTYLLILIANAMIHLNKRSVTRDRAEWLAGRVAVLGSHWLRRGFFSRDFHLFDLTYIYYPF